MNITFIKHFFIILCSFYFYTKLLNIKPSKKNLITHFFVSIILTGIVCFIKLYTPYLTISTIVFGIIITEYFTNKIPFNITLFTSITSFGFSYLTFLISTFLLLPVASLIVIKNPDNKTNFFLITHTILGIMQLSISFFIFRIKRLKNGMPFLYKKNYNAISIFISTIIFIPTTFYCVYKDSDAIFISFILLTCIYGFILYLWWKKQLTNSYKEKLITKEIQELHNEIERLKKDNTSLSKIVHKDNKLIPAMEMAVRELLISSPENINEYTDTTTLLETLNTLSKERTGIINSYKYQVESLPSTGIHRIDSLIKYMKQKAFNHNINFSFISNSNLKYLIENIINEDDLCTILADLIENAIIATKEQDTKQILLNIDIEDNSYYINIHDSGVPFETNTLLNLGIIRTTTHSSTGGSGIGLMNTFELLKKYSASFIITESTDTTIFTKTISIYFDNLNQYKIISNRPEIIAISSARNDIIIEKI